MAVAFFIYDTLLSGEKATFSCKKEIAAFREPKPKPLRRRPSKDEKTQPYAAGSIAGQTDFVLLSCREPPSSPDDAG
jgi:hypothetical protein